MTPTATAASSPKPVDTPAGRDGPAKDRPGERRPDGPADVSAGQVRAGGHPHSFRFDRFERCRLPRRTRQPHPEPDQRQHQAQEERGGLGRDEP